MGRHFALSPGRRPLNEGEVAVLKPLGDRYQVVARTAPDDWTTLIDIATKVDARR